MTISEEDEPSGKGNVSQTSGGEIQKGFWRNSWGGTAGKTFCDSVRGPITQGKGNCGKKKIKRHCAFKKRNDFPKQASKIREVVED